MSENIKNTAAESAQNRRGGGERSYHGREELSIPVS